MTAKSLDIFVLDLSDPDWTRGTPERVNDTISYELVNDDSIRTLSTNVPSNGGSLKGLLYVPDLPSNDPCHNISQNFFPNNVTRRSDLPDSGYSLVATAPWISPNCTLSYLMSAHIDPVTAFLFYRPGSGPDKPPPVGDSAWSLEDGGRWKGENPYGVYAVPGTMGDIIMRQLSLYSGNMTDVPHGSNLTEMYDPRDYVRLFAVIDIGDANANLPSLWVFLLIVLGILLVIVTGTSSVMRLIQRSRRHTLRRRIAAGEVDLEVLGIKRLNVPQEVVDKMPLHAYSAGQPPLGNTPAYNPVTQSTPTSNSSIPETAQPVEPIPAGENLSPANAHLNVSEHSNSKGLKKSTSSDLQHHPRFSQPTCPICLDEFVSSISQVRELPCGHIFHPECVDPFLREHSSLCPMCKKSVLPLGYCPDKVTNSMVRRERILRRMRERVTVDDNAAASPHQASEVGLPPEPARSASVVAGTRVNIHRQLTVARGRRISSVPNPVAPSAIEMSSTGNSVGDRVVSNPNPASSIVLPENGATRTADINMRREWGRNRIIASLANRRMGEEEEEAREAAMPKWRKAIGTLFPIFR